jgi:hypothetical protein
MANTIRIKRRSSSGSAGVSGVAALNGELLYNEADNSLYYGYGDAGSGVASSIIAIAGTGNFATLGTTQTFSGAKTFSSSVTFTDTSVTFPSGFALPVNRGGTGSATASDARTALGLAIGSNVQAYDGDLDAIAALAGTSGLLKKTGANTWILDTTAYGTGTVTSVTATAPVVSSGGTTPAISMPAATASVDGYMTSTYAAKLDGIATGATANTGTVTSVAATVPTSIMSISGSPVTTSGTLAVSLATQTANYVWSGPTSGGAATPTFRALVSADIPALSYLSSSGGTVSGNVVVTGTLEVQGGTTTISSTTLLVSDKNIELAVGSTTEAGANGGGITLHGLTDHTIVYTASGSTWDFSDHVNLASGKAFKINGTTVLSATALDGVVVDGGTF